MFFRRGGAGLEIFFHVDNKRRWLWALPLSLEAAITCFVTVTLRSNHSPSSSFFLQTFSLRHVHEKLDWSIHFNESPHFFFLFSLSLFIAYCQIQPNWERFFLTWTLLNKLLSLFFEVFDFFKKINIVFVLWFEVGINANTGFSLWIPLFGLISIDWSTDLKKISLCFFNELRQCFIQTLMIKLIDWSITD